MNKQPSLLRSVFARRIYGLFVLCALLPICLLAALSLLRVSRTIQADSMERLRHTSKNAGMTIVEGLYLLEVELRSIARTVHRGTMEDVRILRSGQADDEEKRFLAFTLFSGPGAGRSLLGPPLSPPRLSPEAGLHLRSGKALLYLSPTNRMFLVITPGGDRAGERMLVAEINPVYLWTLVRHTLPPETELCVVDPFGRILFNSSGAAPHFVSRVMASLANSSVGQLEWNGQGQHALVSYWSIFMTPLYHVDSWTVIASQNREIAFRSLHLFGRTFLLVVGLTLVVVSYLSSILIRRNLGPLTSLRMGANKLSQGELDARVSLRSGDEFEELADTFNTMAERLQRQFLATRETGRIVQEFLAAHDRDTVVRVALSSREAAVRCQVVALSLMDPARENLAVTHQSCPHAPGSTGEPGTATVFSTDELSRLNRARGEYLHVNGCGEFSCLLLPLSGEGGQNFYLFPFFLGGALAGLLTIGYSELPLHISGDLARARHIAEEIAVALDNLRLVEELNQLNWGTIGALANAVDAKSPWTAGHSERVTRLSLDIGRAMGLTEQELELLHLGGLFHDIGKIGVPEAILDKPGRLTDEEYALIKTHAEAGARILRPISAYERIIPVVEQHHEWFNGEGYPHGLAGDEISLGGRILAVADVYDALISDRPYRSGWEPGRVLSHIVGRAWSQFDPLVVEALVAILDCPVAAGQSQPGRPRSVQDVLPS
jgi:putative nucleotidyltransferase with HDIG domain